MPGRKKVSFRHMQIDKSNTVIIIAVAAASACLVFSLVSLRALWGQASYNKRVISAKENTVNQVEANVASLESLKTSYQAFVSEPTNVIGGSATGTGDRDGDNAKITLDAMPSVYDFPGTISGFNKVLSGKSFSEVVITGTDEEAKRLTDESREIAPVPLNFTAEGSTEGVQEFLKILDLSIRPTKIKTVTFSGESTGTLTATVSLETYFQPKELFEVKTEVIK